jgi:hypothetical protein
MNAVSREILFDILETSVFDSPENPLAWVRHWNEVSGAGTEAEQLASQLRRGMRAEYGGDSDEPCPMRALAKEGLRKVQWSVIASRLLCLAAGRDKAAAEGGDDKDGGEREN